MLDLPRLRLLRELRRRGTITAVARAFSFSPSAVSQQLATLERETGVRLVEPAGRRLRLTPQGELLVEHADVLLRQVEHAESALAASVGAVRGTLRVAAFQTAALDLVPPALTRVRDRHPELRVEVTGLEPDLALPAMVAGDHDLVIAEEYPHDPLPDLPAAERSELSDDELLLAMPAGRPDDGLTGDGLTGDGLTADGLTADGLTGLADRPFVMEPPGSPAGRWARATCRTLGFEPDVRFVTTDLQVHLRLVEQGLAVGLVPELSGARARPGVAVHPLPGRPARRILTAVRAGSAAHPAVRAFRSALTSRPSGR